MSYRPITLRAIFILLGTGLILRLLLAYVILPGSGYLGDIGLYSKWALAIASLGPSGFYAETHANYPPGYIYVLWLIGSISHTVASVTGANMQKICNSLIKLPPMLLDAGAGFLIYQITQLWSGQTDAAKNTALLAAASYIFNPVTLYDSAIWGQTDASGVFIMLLGIMALSRWPPEVSASIAVISALIKPQFGVILIPLIGIALLRRHLLARTHSNDSSQHPFWASHEGPVRIFTSVAVATVVFYVLVIPFNMSLEGFIEHMTRTAQQYKFLSVNAFNPWALVGSGNTLALMQGGISVLSRDDIPLIGSLTGVMIGTAFLISGFFLGVARLLWRSDWLSIVLVGAYFCLCFFILPTRVHERYLFPVFGFTALLTGFDRKWLRTTLVLAIGSLMNFHAVLSKIGTPNVMDIPFGQFLRAPTGILISSLLQTAVLPFMAWHLCRTWPHTRYRGVVAVE